MVKQSVIFQNNWRGPSASFQKKLEGGAGRPGPYGRYAYAYTIGHRQAEQRIKSVLNVKQHKRVNDNSLNKFFLLNMFKRIELLPSTRDR